MDDLGLWHNVLTVGWLGAVESEEMVVAPHDAVTVLDLLTFHNDRSVHARPATTQTVTSFTDAKLQRMTLHDTQLFTHTLQ